MQNNALEGVGGFTAYELPSVFLSFSIDIPTAASAHHSHSSAHMESSPTSAQRKHKKPTMGPKKRNQSVEKADIFTLWWPADSEI